MATTSYKIKYEKKARKHLKKLAKNPILLKKYVIIMKAVKDDPYSDTYNFERLQHNLKGKCSRRLSGQDRIVYEVKEDVVIVEVISILGHYEDK